MSGRAGPPDFVTLPTGLCHSEPCPLVSTWLVGRFDYNLVCSGKSFSIPQSLPGPFFECPQQAEARVVLMWVQAAFSRREEVPAS